MSEYIMSLIRADVGDRTEFGDSWVDAKWAEYDSLQSELATMRAENERLRERVKAAEYVLKQARPESGYWDTYAKEALK